MNVSPHFSDLSRSASRPGDAIRQEKAEKRSRATLEAFDAADARRDATLRAPPPRDWRDDR